MGNVVCGWVILGVWNVGCVVYWFEVGLCCETERKICEVEMWCRGSRFVFVFQYVFDVCVCCWFLYCSKRIVVF